MSGCRSGEVSVGVKRLGGRETRQESTTEFEVAPLLSVQWFIVGNKHGGGITDASSSVSQNRNQERSETGGGYRM